MISKSIIDDLISREAQKQCKAIKSLSKLQSEIPPDKIGKEFLPYLIKSVNEEEDALSEI